VAGTENPWTRRRHIDLAELVNEPWTLPPRDSGIGTFAIHAFRTRGLKPPRTTVVTYSMHLRNRLLATGRFLTILPTYALTFPGKPSSLKKLPVDLDNARGMLAIFTLKNRTLSPLAELFINTARAVVKSLPKTR
jgi:DNA-binding transcriptional LysR family regulator